MPSRPTWASLNRPQYSARRDGKLWAYEGCFDKDSGCCNGSCTHVWNYAQAIPHLFPRLERTPSGNRIFSQSGRARTSEFPFCPAHPANRPWVSRCCRRPAGRHNKSVPGLEDIRGYKMVGISLAGGEIELRLLLRHMGPAWERASWKSPITIPMTLNSGDPTACVPAYTWEPARPWKRWPWPWRRTLFPTRNS